MIGLDRYLTDEALGLRAPSNAAQRFLRDVLRKVARRALPGILAAHERDVRKRFFHEIHDTCGCLADALDSHIDADWDEDGQRITHD